MNLEEVMVRHADRAAGAEVTLRDVQQRARRIQRRRRTGAAVGVAAAVTAVVLPVSLLVDGTTRSAPEPGPATQSPSINADAVRQDPLDMRIAKAEPGGAAPTVAWIEGRTLHRLDGSTVELEHDYLELDVVGGDTYLAVRRGDNGPIDGDVLDEIGDDGKVDSTRVITPIGQAAVITSPDKSVAAWTTPEGEVHVWDQQGDRTFATSSPQSNVVAVFGSRTCDDSGDGCRVVVNHADTDPTTYTANGSEPVGGGFLTILTMSPDGRLVAGNRGRTQGGDACIETWDVTADDELQRCQASPFAFSPDGAHTAEYPPTRDGEPAWIEIRDARTGKLTAKVVAKGDSDTSNIEPVVWEDESHYLVTALHEGTWLLLRGDLEGHLEIIRGPIDGPNPGQPYESPYVIAR